MAIYFIYVSVIAGFGAVLSIGNDMKWKKILLSVIGFSLVAYMLSTRYVTGWDTSSYYRMYLNTAMTSIGDLTITRIEKGFTLLHKAFTLTSVDIMFGQTVISVISILLLAVVIHKHCDNVWIAYLALFGSGSIFMAMNYQRQFLAMAVSAFAFIYVQRKDIFRFGSLILLASTFHYSALVLLPCYFIFQIPYTKITGIFYAVFIGLFYIFSKPIFSAFIYLVSVIRFGYNMGDFKDFDISMAGGEFSGGVPVKYIILLLALTILATLLAKKLRERNAFNNVMLHCLAVSLFAEVIGIKYAYISRFGLNCMPLAFMVITCEIVALAKIKIATYNKEHQLILNILLYVIVFACNFAMMYVMIKGNYNGCNPYVWIHSL